MNGTPRKVLVIVARGLQLGALGCYGNGWIDTPALDRLAAEGVVFDQHFADAASPEGAHAAWRSGCYALPDGTPHPSAERPDLVRSLTAAGVPCCLVVDESRPLPADFVQDWTAVHTAVPTDDETFLEATVAAAETCLKDLAGQEQWLLWVELATLLPPWDTPMDFLEPYFTDEPLEDDDQPLQDDDEEDEPLTPLEDPEPGLVDTDDDTLYLRLLTTYGAAVTYVDAGIGQLLDTLQDLELAQQTLVLVVSDCGQALGEHGLVGAIRPWLHEEIIHLPLLVRLPGLAAGGRRVAALTQAVDLAPTLAQVFGMADWACHGHSLAPLLHGDDGKAVRAYACAGTQVGEGIEWCLRTPDWAFLLPVQAQPAETGRTPQLYVKPDDRWEVNNVLQHYLEWSEALGRMLRAFVTASRHPGPLQAPALPASDLSATPAEPSATGASAR